MRPRLMADAGIHLTWCFGFRPMSFVGPVDGPWLRSARTRT
jgi:hypothetical protein